jgi:hypothetical protein
MGSELLCTLHFEDKTVRGKALLESSEILFRGELRLKIPFSSMQSVDSRNGELHVKWADGTAVFELGEQADKWAHKILHPRSTMEKLRVKPGMTISAVTPPSPEFVGELRASAATFSGAKLLKNSDLIFYGVETLAELDRTKDIASSLAPAGALWIVYPKGRKEIKEQHVLDAGKQAGLVDVKVVSFSPTHTALKFVVPKARR